MQNKIEGGKMKCAVSAFLMPHAAETLLEASIRKKSDRIRLKEDAEFFR